MLVNRHEIEETGRCKGEQHIAGGDKSVLVDNPYSDNNVVSQCIQRLGSEANNIVKQRDITDYNSGNSILVKSGFCTIKNTKLLDKNDGVSVTPQVTKVNLPFTHRVAGASKQVGVHFPRIVHNHYIHPRSHLARNATPHQYLQAVSKITTSGKPNYQHCKIAIESSFNINFWRERLNDYHDKHVVNLLQYGFPLGINNGNKLCRKQVDNHSSAVMFPTEVGEYIDTEKQHGTLLGPFTGPPHPEYHCSPLMTRPKDIVKRRVIVDLSYGDDSVNGSTDRELYEGEPFQLQLQTVDHVLDQLLQLKDPRLVKADISRAFRNVPVDPRDAIKCGVAFNGQF